MIEVPARVDAAGPVALPQRPLAPELLGLTQHVTAYERLAAEAAVTRDVVTARKALLAHPLIGQHERVDAWPRRMLARGGGVSGAIVFAVDGGNSKTDLALVRDDGTVLSLVRGPLSSPHHIGARRQPRGARRAVGAGDGGSGADPHERPDRRGRQALHGRRRLPCRGAACCSSGSPRSAGPSTPRSRTTRTRCSAPAPTTAGASALVCGAGINCVAVAPDGREVRFPALGEITGDWGGGRDVGMSAARSRGAKRGRPRPAHDPRAARCRSSSGSRRPDEVAEAIHVGRLDGRRVTELPPLVLRGGGARRRRGRDRRAAHLRDRRVRACIAAHGST